MDRLSRVENQPLSWDGIYDAKGETAVSWYQDAPGRSISLLDDAGVSSSASVVDVGAGASRLVDALLARGHTDVSVLDVSGAGLDLAKERLGVRAEVPRWIVTDLLRWQPERAFDVWHDRAVFHFLLAEEDRSLYRSVLLAATHPGSLIVIATFAEDGPTTCSGRPVDRYSAEELGAQIGSGFTVLVAEREVHQTPSGATQPFTWLLLRRDR